MINFPVIRLFIQGFHNFARSILINLLAIELVELYLKKRSNLFINVYYEEN